MCERGTRSQELVSRRAVRRLVVVLVLFTILVTGVLGVPAIERAYWQERGGSGWLVKWFCLIPIYLLAQLAAEALGDLVPHRVGGLFLRVCAGLAVLALYLLLFVMGS